MRGLWLDDDDHDDAPGSNARAPVVDAEPAASDPSTRRGMWLATAHAAVITGSLNDTTETPSWVSALCVLGFLGIVAMELIALGTGDNELQAGVIFAVVLTFVSFAVFRHLAKADGNPRLVPLLQAAFSLKILGTYARYQVGNGVYAASDATQYDTYGRRWAHDYLSHGQLPPDVKTWTSTNFVRLLTAELYHYTTTSLFAGYVAFSFVGFCGLMLMWRGFRRVYPSGERKFFYLILFAPSMVYWPSSIGKEAVVIFGIGLTTYGFARALTKSVVIGLASIAGGIYLVMLVRAHIALALLIGLFLGGVLRKRGRGQALGTIFTILAFALIAPLVISRTNSMFKTDVTDASSVTSSFQDTVQRTEQGGSAYTPVLIHSPVDFPYAFVTVMFRPFPWETRSPQTVLTSIESLVYAFMLLHGLRDLLRRFRRDQPFAFYALANIVVFTIMFSNFANFGILARQRTQVLPFLFMLIALPPRPPKDRYVPMMTRLTERPGDQRIVST